MILTPLRVLSLALLASFIINPCAVQAADTAPTAEHVYATAVENMRHMPVPPNTTYAVDIHVDGAGFLLSRQPDGHAQIAFVIGDSSAKPDGHFDAAYRASDGALVLQTKPDEWLYVRGPLFNPTWSGISDWIHYGLGGRPATATPTPMPSPQAPGTAPEIAAVRAIGVAFYNVYDSGAGTCANGDPARRMHVIAREDPADHPLTDATIDLSEGQFCALVFHVRKSGAVSASGDVTLHLGNVGGSTFVTDESFVIVAHVLGFAVKKVTATAHYNDVAFPAALDPALFSSATPRTERRGDGRRARFLR